MMHSRDNSGNGTATRRSILPSPGGLCGDRSGPGKRAKFIPGGNFGSIFKRLTGSQRFCPRGSAGFSPSPPVDSSNDSSFGSASFLFWPLPRSQGSVPGEKRRICSRMAQKGPNQCTRAKCRVSKEQPISSLIGPESGGNGLRRTVPTSTRHKSTTCCATVSWSKLTPCDSIRCACRAHVLTLSD